MTEDLDKDLEGLDLPDDSFDMGGLDDALGEESGEIDLGGLDDALGEESGEIDPGDAGGGDEDAGIDLSLRDEGTPFN